MFCFETEKKKKNELTDNVKISNDKVNIYLNIYLLRHGIN